MIVAGEPVAGTLARPQWTIPAFGRTRGRYPLGIEAVNLSELDDLASGLPVLSQHPRYWSMYTYIVKSYWDRRITPQTNAGLGHFLRPHEIAFAAAALRCQRHPELPGIIGRDTIAPYLAQGRSTLRLDLDYLGQRLGGYAQVYRGAMADLGLILRADLTPGAMLDAPFGGVGASVADAFRDAIAATTYAKRYAGKTEGTIPLDVIDELAQVSCFCRLPQSPTERGLLVDVLLGRSQPPHQAHRNRAATVRMYLELAKQTQGHEINEEDFRVLIYWGAEDSGASWRPSPAVDSAWRRWWLIRHREVVVGALNALFVHFVRWGVNTGGMLSPLALIDYATELSKLRMPSEFGLGSGRLNSLALKTVLAAIDESVRRDGWPVEPASDSMLEDEILDRADWGRAAGAPSAALLALLVALRRLPVFADKGEDSATERAMLDEGGIDRVSTNTLTQWTQQQDGSLADLLFNLLRIFVVRQHLRIARGKLNQGEDTFRFHDQGGSLLFVNQDDAEGINPISIRFNAVATALSELGLTAAPFGEPKHGLTSLGEEVLHA